MCLFFASCGCARPKVAGHGCFRVRLILDPKVRSLDNVSWMNASLTNAEHMFVYLFVIFIRLTFAGKPVVEAICVIAANTNAQITVKCWCMKKMKIFASLQSCLHDLVVIYLFGG